MSNREFEKNIERVKTDLDILKKAHELGIATAPDKPTENKTERLSQDELIQKIISKRRSILHMIESTDGIATGTKRRWKDILTNIDLFNSEAEMKVQELYSLLDDYYNDLPADYGGYKTDITLLEMNIGIIQTDLLNLKNLCFDYKQGLDND